MKCPAVTEFKESFQETISNLELFVKLNSLEKPSSFLEFRADLHVIVTGLIRLLHVINLQTMTDKAQSRAYDRLRQTVIKILVDCSCREHQCFTGRIPEWEQIVQEEKLRIDLLNLLDDLAEKLKKMQKDLNSHGIRQSNHLRPAVAGVRVTT